MTVNERLKKLRNKTGLNQKDFADRAGIAQYAMNRVEKGYRLPDAEFLMALRENYEADLNLLLCGNSASIVEGSIPLYDCEELSKPVEDRAASQWISHPDLPEDCFAWRIRDNSMFPLLSSGDTVIVSDRPTKTGDFILCCDKTGKNTVRRLCCLVEVGEEADMLAVPENSDYLSLSVSDFKIIGRVEAHLRLSHMR